MTKENELQIVEQIQQKLKQAKESIENNHYGTTFFHLESVTQLSVQLTKVAYQKTMENYENGPNH